VYTVDNELFHINSNMHKHNMKTSDDDLTVLSCVTGFKTCPSCVETGHLIGNQEHHISNTDISQFGYTGMLNHTNSATHISYEEYELDIELNPELFKALNQKYGQFEMELFASDTNHFL